ncbi:MAG: response regulator [Phoenicibacter congonensis]|uniref:Response regulator n=1 Tax=Phoenicibacter congonensis TaxID=1944646 RepID=A0AA43RI64_9ACTN|nr:response regulator [Phoenicibacter congonensis]
MEILCVDDEMLSLELLEQAVNDAVPNAKVHAFRKPKEALAFVEEAGALDIAFLDIDMRGMTGVELGELLKAKLPCLNIVFVTAYSDYTGDAMKMRASGYVFKPVTKEKIEAEIENLRYSIAEASVVSALASARSISSEVSEDANLPANLVDSAVAFSETEANGAKLKIQCFGSFEVFAEGKPVKFSRSLAKEVLAYLVERRGSTCTIRELSAVLFEDEPFTNTKRSYVQSIISSLMKSLDEVGAKECVVKSYNSISIAPEKIDCDFYKFLEGDRDAQLSYFGEFMSQYSWAENTNAALSMSHFS